jgi:hypothetical protein
MKEGFCTADCHDPEVKLERLKERDSHIDEQIYTLMDKQAIIRNEIKQITHDLRKKRISELPLMERVAVGLMCMLICIGGTILSYIMSSPFVVVFGVGAWLFASAVVGLTLVHHFGPEPNGGMQV